MDDLDRLFHHLVDHIARTTPDRLQKPFQVSELYQRLVPYRTHKSELGFESIEDYEMAVLRLLAGESAYARVEPPDVQEALAAEAKQVNPDPGAFREFAAASVVLDREAVQRIVNHEAAYAPPELHPPESPEATPEVVPVLEARALAAPPTSASATPPPTVEEDDTTLRIAAIETRELVFEPVGASSDCPSCDEELPAGRDAVFCPFCGEQLAATPCGDCGELIEPGWKYCLACGTPTRRSRPTDTT